MNAVFLGLKTMRKCMLLHKKSRKNTRFSAENRAAFTQNPNRLGICIAAAGKGVKAVHLGHGRPFGHVSGRFWLYIAPHHPGRTAAQIITGVGRLSHGGRKFLMKGGGGAAWLQQIPGLRMRAPGYPRSEKKRIFGFPLLAWVQDIPEILTCACEGGGVQMSPAWCAWSATVRRAKKAAPR